MVITNIGLLSWLINNYETSEVIKIIADMSSIIILSLAIVFVDKKIKAKIRSLRNL